MNIEKVREYCMSLPYVTEDMAFGDDCLLFRVCGKIFACYSFVRDDYFVVKTDPDEAIDLRDRYCDIEPAWHWNKKYWSQFRLKGALSEEMICHLIRKSYIEVVKKLTKKVIADHPMILTVKVQ